MKPKRILMILCSSILLASCGQTESKEADGVKEGMIKVTILYPNGEGKTFDMDYYANKHMPMVARLLGDSLKLQAIDNGLSGRTPDEPIPYLAIGYLYFDQLSAYRNSFGPNAKQIVGDIPNYTNIQPIVQISEVLQPPGN
ncbi:EthD family reductase [Flagellimonas nanhaiensis]|nr:EthD family reductase [Allomuricauda nanhaiensis]